MIRIRWNETPESIVTRFAERGRGRKPNLALLLEAVGDVRAGRATIADAFTEPLASRLATADWREIGDVAMGLPRASRNPPADRKQARRLKRKFGTGGGLYTRRRVAFFQQHAGRIVGESAKGAIALARAEEYANANEWSVEWQDDPDGWGDVQSDVRQGYTEKGDIPERIETAILYDADGKVLASLSGIYDADRTYRRVIAAELALEAMSDA